MAIVRCLFFKAANNNYTVVIRHILSASNVIADALSRTQMPKFHALAPRPTPLPVEALTIGLPAATFFLNERIAASSGRTYKTGVSRYTKFCRQRKWSPFPASESSLVEFVASAASEVQYQTLKVYLVGIKHHHQVACTADPAATSIHLSLVLRGIKGRNFDYLQNLAFQSLSRSSVK